MKKVSFFAVLAFALALILGVIACTTGNGGGDTSVDSTEKEETTATTTEDSTEPGSEKPEDTTAAEETSAEETTRGELHWETYDPALDDSKVNPSGIHLVDPSQWVGIDDVGRVLPTNTEVGNARENKTVAVFYWTWHGDFYKHQTAYNVQQILDRFDDSEEAEEYLWKSSTSPDSAYHFWNEPIWGYYSGNDEWVIRKQAEMLAAAGVDVIFFDNTNGAFTWLNTALTVFKVFSEAQEQGVKVPQISFLLPFGGTDGSATQIKQLYAAIYEKGLYEDLWYKMDGKPMLMGYDDNISDATIRNFFTFRKGVGGYNDRQLSPGTPQWGWLSAFPQAIYYRKDRTPEQMTVGVAVNYDYSIGSISPMNYGINIVGRTYTTKGLDTRENAVLYGANFAEQWNNALYADPDIVFVTGWNEWVAMKLGTWPGTSFKKAFVDQYNDAYSRDCEPSKGKLKDNYYYQLVSNIRRFKGVSAIPAASGEKLIDINGGYGQWANVTPAYNDYFGMTNRDSDGYKDPETKKPYHYINETARNDIYEAKVARDYENIYFMVRTVEDLSPYTDAYWMRLYIDTVAGGDRNWEEYEYIVNRTSPASQNKTVLERFTGNGFETEKVCDIEYSVKGNVLMLKIPKSALEIEGYDFSLDFKWTDNTQEDGDIMQWYTNGDVAPIGRYNYRYTTTGSAAYEGTELTVPTDLTDRENVDGLLASGALTAENVTLETGADGTVLTVAGGKEPQLTVHYDKYSPRPTADQFRYLAITYRADSDMPAMVRFNTLLMTATKAGNKKFTLPGDGQVHTVYIDLKSARNWSYNYADYITFVCDTGATAGKQMTLLHFDLLHTLPEGAELLNP